MNAQPKQDQSFFNMVEEHQQLAERVLRLHALLNQHPCVEKMPTEACTLINEMKNIVTTGKAQPGGLETANLNFDLPYTDPEFSSYDHNFTVGDTVWVPSEFARHKLKVSSKQVFKVEKLEGKDQLYVCCVPHEKFPFTNNQKCFTAHYSHFQLIDNKESTSCAE